MKPRNESLILTILTVGAVVLAFVSGYLAHDLFATPNRDFPILAQAQEILIENTIRSIPGERRMEYGMIRGMIATLEDPFTTFNEPAQHELQTDSLQGTFGGIGVRLVQQSDGAFLLYPFPEGPASLAGIQDGDMLVAVDGRDFKSGAPVDEITAAIRGPEGTDVRIRISRGSAGELLDFSIQRAEVPLPSVTWRISAQEQRLGIIEINIIADRTPEEIRAAVEDLRTQGATHFAMDLRANGGGLLDAGVDAARLFLADGVVIQQQYRDREVDTFSVREPGPLEGLPLLIWVDHGTASAAEILAGSLQAQGRAELIGSPTFGKDVIQLVFELRDGSSIQVAAARWWFPDFQFPNGDAGLLPDHEIAPGPEAGLDYERRTIEIFFEGGG